MAEVEKNTLFALKRSENVLQCDSAIQAYQMSTLMDDSSHYVEIHETNVYVYDWITRSSNYKKGSGFRDHYWSDIHIYSEATCTKDATWTWECKYCHDFGSTTHSGAEGNDSLSYLDKLGHKWKWVENSAGTRRTKTCSRCKKSLPFNSK